MSSRISHFAEAMTPAIAEMAGRMIKGVDDQAYARKDHEFAAECIWASFQAKHRGPACRLMTELFQPLDDWGKESAIAASTLLLRAFTAAIEQPGVWDRRFSANTLASKIKTEMYDHIREWASDRG